MLLIEIGAVPTPADAERLVADLWQMSAGRPIGLFTLAVGGRVMLGVHSPHRGLEETAAATVSEQSGGAVQGGWMVPQVLNSARDVAAANLIPTNRHLAIESRTFGWQRTDPLRGTFLALAHAPLEQLLGVGISLRALPDLTFLASVGVFGAGPGAGAGVARVVAALGGVGIRVRRPFPRRTICRILDAAVRRPAAVQRAELVALFWHPPYAHGLDRQRGEIDETVSTLGGSEIP